MPAQKRRRTGTKAAATKRAPATPPTPAQAAAGESRRLIVLGPGADVSYGLPTMSTLLRELATFAKGDGLPIHNALQTKLPSLRFTFDKY